MPTIQSDDAKKRRASHDPPTGMPGDDGEPRVPDENSRDLDDDQADSGPDRDRKIGN